MDFWEFGLSKLVKFCVNSSKFFANFVNSHPKGALFSRKHMNYWLHAKTRTLSAVIHFKFLLFAFTSGYQTLSYCRQIKFGNSKLHWISDEPICVAIVTFDAYKSLQYTAEFEYSYIFLRIPQFHIWVFSYDINSIFVEMFNERKW